jgi:hypothetical protein
VYDEDALLAVSAMYAIAAAKVSGFHLSYRPMSAVTELLKSHFAA